MYEEVEVENVEDEDVVVDIEDVDEDVYEEVEVNVDVEYVYD